MGHPIGHKKVLPGVKSPESQISSTTLVLDDAQMSESTPVPESSQTGRSSRSSFFNPVPLRRARPSTQPPKAATATITNEDPIMKDEYEENYYFHHLPRGNTHDDTTDDEPMYDELQATTDSNYLPTGLSTASTEGEELSAKQASLNINDYGSHVDTRIKENILFNHPTDTIKRPGINISNVAAAQRAMLERKLLGAKQLKSVIDTKSYQAQAESNTSAPSGYDDNSWMNETPESDDEYENLVRTVETLQRRHINGKITNAEGVALFRLKRELTLRNKLRQAAASANRSDTEDEGLFVQEETREEVAQRHAIIAASEHKGVSPTLDAGDEDNGDSNARIQLQRNAEDSDLGGLLQQALNAEGIDPAITEKELTKTKKQRRKPAKNAREFHAREEQDRQDKERRKAQKKKARELAKPSRQKAATKGGKATKKGKGGVKANKEMETLIRSVGSNTKDGIDEIAKMILEDLMSSDQIADRLNDPIFNTAPETQIYGNHKATQLQQLLANIPGGTDSTIAKNDKVSLLQASKSFGYANVRAVDGKWLVKGMRNTLYHHQLLGAQWMLSRELSSQAPFGGLLADGMGLGKTVQMLACMLGNFPQEQDYEQKRKATLIVAPSSVINQWMDEIRAHVDEAVFPLIYHYRSSSKVTKEMLENLDIVVTSYTEVMRQLPFPDQKNRSEIAKLGYKTWVKNAHAQLGDLHKVFWYRVVLDEAHAIKNHIGRTSLACQNLRSVYRWCLTGTPLLNRVEE
jgi:SNF2 family DNA or RNA helicase